MKILVTGATGFIGKHLCLTLSRQGHEVIALMRSPDAVTSLQTFVAARGGQAEQVVALAGNLEQADLGLNSRPENVDCVVHLAARFAWNLPPNEARLTNVTGSVRVAQLARDLNSRLVFVSGFMLANTAHLERIGVRPSEPERTDWPRIYRKLGGYEASKLEGAFSVRAFASQHRLDTVEIQPATVAGHTETGEIDPGQPLYGLMDNLFHGRMAMMPGSPRHWLPLIPVDTLAELIAAACCAPRPPRTLLALDDTSPNLQGLLAALSQTTGQTAPKRHLPIPLMRALLRLPGLATLLKVAPESLDFIQPQRFDTTVTKRFLAASGIGAPDFASYLAASAHYYLERASHTGKVDAHASKSLIQ